MIHRRALPLALVLSATGATAHTAPLTAGVTLLPPYETATPKAGSLAEIRLKSLARIDPVHPLAGAPNLQTFSQFGREDLIAEGALQGGVFRADEVLAKLGG